MGGTSLSEDQGRGIAINRAGGTLGSAIRRRLAAQPGTVLVLSDVDQSSLVDTAVKRLGRLDALPRNPSGKVLKRELRSPG